MAWLFYAGGSVFLFTTFNLLQRIIAKDAKDPRVSVFVFNLTAAVISIGIFLISKDAKSLILPNETIAWVYLAIALLFYGLTERLRFIAAKMADASVLSTITNISTVIAFASSVILYQESISSQRGLGALLIFISLIIISFEKGKTITTKGLIMAILYSITIGIAWSLDKMGAVYFSPTFYNLLVWVLPLAVIFVPYIKPKEVIEEYRSNSWRTVLLSILCVSAYLCQLKTFTLVEFSRAIPILQTSTIFTVIGGTLLLKEKGHWMKKLIAGTIAVIGSGLLV